MTFRNGRRICRHKYTTKAVAPRKIVHLSARCVGVGGSGEASGMAPGTARDGRPAPPEMDGEEVVLLAASRRRRQRAAFGQRLHVLQGSLEGRSTACDVL